MPGDRIRPRLKNFPCTSIVRTSMYQMDFRVTPGCSAGRMNVETAEVFTKFQRVRDWEFCKVLILEYFAEIGISLLSSGVEDESTNLPTTFLRATNKAN